MEQRFAGRSGLRVSSIGLGTATWGGETDADGAAAQLAAFRDSGGTLVDTAAGHGAGRAETILGALLGDHREQLVVSTRTGPARSGARPGDGSRGALLDGLDRSLRRLRVDHIDLWQVAPGDTVVPVEETLAALDHAVSSGKVRYAGVVDHPGWRLAQAVTWQSAGLVRAPIVVEQVEYSLLSRGIEREVAPAARALGVGLICYSPLGGGVLTGKYRDPVAAGARAIGGPAPGEARGPGAVHAHGDARAHGIVEAVATAAEGLATSPLAVALSWVLGRPGVTAAVVGARTAAQLTASLHVDAQTIPDAIRNALDEVSAPVLGYPEDVG